MYGQGNIVPLTGPCPCPCGHVPGIACPEGCYPEGSEDGRAEIDFDAWTCIGGELNMLYDRREG